MTHVMAQCGHSENSKPVVPLAVIGQRFEPAAQIVRYIPWVRDYVEDSRGEFHDSQGVFESLVRGGGIDEICQRQLMDVAQSLEAP